jgi:hypothetical protein
MSRVARVEHGMCIAVDEIKAAKLKVMRSKLQNPQILKRAAKSSNTQKCTFYHEAKKLSPLRVTLSHCTI